MRVCDCHHRNVLVVIGSAPSVWDCGGIVREERARVRAIGKSK
jgi:hypothetical protein